MKDLLTYQERERQCATTFLQLGPCYHLSTSEDFEIIFRTDEDFKAAMTLLAICAMAFPDIIILTFELMTNHLHILFAGDRSRGKELFDMFILYLGRYLKGKKYTVDLSSWVYDPRLIEDLEDVRNVIAYDNRNGYVVNPSHTPFSYPWGANGYFFNPFAKSLSSLSKEVLTVRMLRSMFHTHDLDSYSGQKIIDGYVTPMAFCRIAVAERLFRDAWQYFSKVAKDVENYRELAKQTGERFFYTDTELFSVVSSWCRDKYDSASPALLPKDAKLEIARKMHYDYNSSNKQIARILRIDISAVDSLFPKSSRHSH